MTATDEPLLSIADLRVTLPTPDGPAPILRGVSFDVAAGQMLGLVGESGSGKSMTALAIMGLLPDKAMVEGSIRLAGEELTRLSEPELCKRRGRNMAMIFQEPMTALNPVKTIGQQVSEGMRLHLGIGRAEADGRARRLLERVGLNAKRFPLDLYPHQLSGGQRQRVMIAAALACEPKLLIADEPTTALDVTIQAQILDLVVELVEEMRMGLVLITHDLGVIAETVDKTAVMYAGSIVEAAPTEPLFAQMGHPYTHGLFAAIPHAHGLEHAADGDGPAHTRPRLATIPGTVPDPRRLPPGCAFAGRCPRSDAACAGDIPWVPLAPDHGVACVHPVAKGEHIPEFAA
ncbi:MAG: ABC transporter ATP-binding protein [Tistrella sp.]|jgi:peptide/nickel transport system ATP-binding protein|uniref:ABC transporter ATP-binding protein n=1 Tax=Tistrella mobilis TaxID=171437 RepID=A0A3B9INP5_9PROT|nr:ABC transporter ATP-binding protein [Tistrella sp.]MAD39362.1 ABC transporter ATP-binding protein [Tistrella sp.]MAM73947.1 ABC transporter ATP-binding protein [Tistrella sp.]MBA76378.1 ABC transporter ATP-binding protein [Tistrella sp.]HAE48923.1 ABC transporter ATP-binding protein [Tistrella mobilis]